MSRAQPSPPLLIAAVLLIALVSAPGHAGAEEEPQTPSAAVCDPGTITLLTEEGPRRFEVELARTPAEQARGLMFRPQLAPGTGMLFVYDPPQPTAFWMKNTMIPLDMIFIDDRGRVANVVHRAEPYSLESRRSDGPVRAVLEVNGGVAGRLGIQAGTEARHPAFRAAPEETRCPAG